MDRQWQIRQQLELLSSPTSVQYHRIETYSSIVEGVRRVRRILSGERQRGLFYLDLKEPRSRFTHSVYGRKRPYTFILRPYFGVLHDPVLRSYISVTVYGEI